MERLALIEAFIRKDYAKALAKDVALRPLEEINIFNVRLVTEYLESHSELLEGFRVTNDADSSYVMGETDRNILVKLSFKNDAIKKIVLKANNPNNHRIKMVVEYDGTDYSGFQRQSTLKSIQSELETAISAVNGYETSIHGASRTDAGVHALGQIVDFDTVFDFDADKWKIILNNQLPKDIRIKRSESVPQLFHARFDVETKQYRYILNLGEFSAFRRNYEWTLPMPVDLSIFERELKKFEGTHDFSSFCKGEKASKIRTIFETRMDRRGNHVEVTFIGDGFLHNMIRIIIALLVDIASGRSLADVNVILKNKNRKATTHLAPSGGLYLVEVKY